MGITERIDAITNIPGEYRREDPPAPKSVKIELTARCNFRCAYCARAQDLRQVGDMDTTFFERVVLEMREAGVEELGLFYLGESFLCPWLPHAVRYAKHIAGFPYVFLTSNGSAATPERVAAVMESGLDSLKWSLNYADKEQFVQIARVKPKLFDRVLENIRSASQVREDLGCDTGLYASYIAYDGEQGKRMIDVVEQVRPYVDEIYALPLYGQAGPQDSPVTSTGMAAVGGNSGRLENARPPLPCWAVFQEGHITYDGKLSACCWDHSDGLSMADLNSVSFMQGWHSDKFRALRSAHLAEDVRKTPCRECIYGV